MGDLKVCYDCAFWYLFFSSRKYKKEHDYEIIGGHVYVVNNEETGDVIVYNIYRVYILYHNGSVQSYNDCFHIGKLTEPYRKKHKDTAKFITQKLYNRLKNRQNFKCQAKGCYDRYNCMFYHPEEHEQNGPFNQIPNDWVVGNEKCPHFANRNDILEQIDDKQFPF